MRRVGRRLGKGYDLCMCYTTPSTESPTVASQRLQGPVLAASPYPSFVCDSHRSSQLGVGSPSGQNARACICQTHADAMACLGCVGVGVGVPSQWLFGHLAGSDPKARSALQNRKGTQLVPSLKPTPESQQAASSRNSCCVFPSRSSLVRWPERQRRKLRHGPSRRQRSYAKMNPYSCAAHGREGIIYGAERPRTRYRYRRPRLFCEPCFSCTIEFLA
jgi:hypothetical protein